MRYAIVAMRFYRAFALNQCIKVNLAVLSDTVNCSRHEMKFVRTQYR
jgi:hypothetical protein